MQQSQPTQQLTAKNVRQTDAGQIYLHRNQKVFIPDGYLAIGRIIGAHSLRGEVKIELHTDFPERFAPDTEVLIGQELRELLIVDARPHKQHLLVRFKGVNNRNAVEELSGQWIFVAETDAVQLDEDTYWVHEIVGMAVSTEEGLALGVIDEVIFTGANDVYVVKTPPTVNHGKDLLIPAIADVVQSVDLANNVMTVRLLPGMLEPG